MLPLSPVLQSHAQSLLEQWREHPEPLPLPEEEQLAVLASSQFVTDSLLAFPQWWHEIVENPPQAQEWQFYRQWLEAALESVTDENGLMKALRLFRRRTLTRIAWSQSAQTSEAQDTLQQLSELAELLIVSARDWLYEACCREFGTPVNEAGEPQRMLILGMGKLGGGELNFSSDIDLIFAYPENGQTRGGRRELENSQFFLRLGQRLIKALDQPTLDGFVYRVDMRLRPSGPSAVTP